MLSEIEKLHLDNEFKNTILNSTKSTSFEIEHNLQTLWGGYGQILKLKLFGSKLDSVIVKYINAPLKVNHPRGWNTNFSHLRKLKSYKVEMHWYENWSNNCDEFSKIPFFFSSKQIDVRKLIILEDLTHDFPIKKRQINLEEIKLCIKWLSYFHAKFLGYEPNGLWEIGTYWHLDTRPEEFEIMENSDLKENAKKIDSILNKCNFKTIVHGDAKLANFCFSENSKNVSAVDFQYVGGGCGIKDYIYFLSSCLDENDCEKFEKTLLDYYFFELRNAVEFYKINIEFNELEKEWRLLFPVAWADFYRFLLGWMPEHYKVNPYSTKLSDWVVKNINKY